MLKFVCIFLFACFSNIEGHTYHLGGCPDVEPMSSFDMKQLLGVWYAIEKTSTASSCIVYNFTKSDEPYEYNLEQTSQHFILGLTPLNHEYKYTGILHVPDSSVPAKMKIKFPLNFFSSNFTVITATPEYAVVFNCQKWGFIHRQSATILSRNKTLDKLVIVRIREELSDNKVNPHDLSTINQSNCPKRDHDTHVINIDDETLSAKSFSNVIKKTGELVGDGVEKVAGGVHTVYDKVVN